MERKKLFLFYILIHRGGGSDGKKIRSKTKSLTQCQIFFLPDQPNMDIMYKLTEWEGLTGKYLTINLVIYIKNNFMPFR